MLTSGTAVGAGVDREAVDREAVDRAVGACRCSLRISIRPPIGRAICRVAATNAVLASFFRNTGRRPSVAGSTAARSLAA